MTRKRQDRNTHPAEETELKIITNWPEGTNQESSRGLPHGQLQKQTEGHGGPSQVAELKAIQLALDITEQEKWTRLYLYTDSTLEILKNHPDATLCHML
ncbi:hypothetical protein WISP_64875 [Willisornis vidua]|uniref:RNase H type-1 domain-containing protein n=1 Tax=Willisornis vidua TaxID=1566151 RepID=A0ABQ9DEF2_9PASS|nr:hypothetical protein WISP_64875 [Willisornis vidua]